MYISAQCLYCFNPNNPIALRKAKIVYNFGLSERSGVNHSGGIAFYEMRELFGD